MYARRFDERRGGFNPPANYSGNAFSNGEYDESSDSDAQQTTSKQNSPLSGEATAQPLEVPTGAAVSHGQPEQPDIEVPQRFRNTPNYRTPPQPQNPQSQNQHPQSSQFQNQQHQNPPPQNQQHQNPQQQNQQFQNPQFQNQQFQNPQYQNPPPFQYPNQPQYPPQDEPACQLQGQQASCGPPKERPRGILDGLLSRFNIDFDLDDLLLIGFVLLLTSGQFGDGDGCETNDDLLLLIALLLIIGL